MTINIDGFKQAMEEEGYSKGITEAVTEKMVDKEYEAYKEGIPQYIIDLRNLVIDECCDIGEIMTEENYERIEGVKLALEVIALLFEEYERGR
jgi:hypothetical protein